MTRRTAKPAPATRLEQEFGADPATRIYSLGFMQLESGTVHVVIGKMDMTTRRYRFIQLPEDTFPWAQSVKVSNLIRLCAVLVEEDPEACRL